MKNVTLNDAQCLYVIATGNGYSSHGFDVVERKIEALRAHLSSLDNGTSRGTLARYAFYTELCAQAEKTYKETGKRCDAELCPQLIGLERCRVEVTQHDGEKRRFIVGKSTGWMPIHLEIKTRRSCGGVGVYGAPFESVRVIARNVRL